MKDLPPEEQDKLFKRIKAVRGDAKSTNYAATYGSGAATLARTAKVSLKEAQTLLDAYWKLNWSVKKVAEDMEVKSCLGGKWLLNPVSGIWHVLRHDRDRFSTANQSTGVWAFDTWIKYVRTGGPPMLATFHDEGVWQVREGMRGRVVEHIRKAMDKTNNELKLDRELDCEVQFGQSYSDIH
jgi:DNA polymerase I-like protein with 3'-5' exonuclease and polymerase domains